MAIKNNVEERSEARAHLSLLLSGCVLVACSGTIAPGSAEDDGRPPAPRGDAVGGSSGRAVDQGAGTAAGNGAGGSRADPALEERRIAPRIWRLTEWQFNDEVRRLFGDGAPEVSIPAAAGEHGITNMAANAVVDLGNASLFADGARTVARWVVERGAEVSGCAQYGTDACIDSLLSWLPQRAFRRAVPASEAAELRALFDELRRDYEYDYAFAGVVRAVLLSPDFLYRTELGEAGTMEPHEIANLLAFAITDEGPDAELLAAAERGELSDPDEREAQARRLMERSARAFQRFFWEWLEMRTLYSQGDEVGLPPALVAQMEEEYRAFVREVVVERRGSLHELLSASYTFARPELAAHYGLEHAGTGLARVELDPAQRGGLLTQGAWLVSHGKRGRDNVVRRGMNIYKQAMCNNALNPPPGLDVQAELAKLVGSDATVRETVQARGEAPVCGGCHRVADPVGLVFENFASDARFQETYPDGRPVDSAIELAGVGRFDDARAFSAALADDLAFQRCLVQRFTQFLVGIDLGATGRVAWLQQAHERFLETDTSFEELLVAIVRHPAFVERRAEDEP
jgi:hypothetical protein